MSSSVKSELRPSIGPTVRSIVSLVLVIHLFSDAICFFSVFEPAPLPQRLLGVMAPYLQAFNHDLDYAPYYLTRDRLDPEFLAQFREREYRVEALPQGADNNDPNAWFQLGGDRAGWTESYRRLQRLAYIPVVGQREEDQAEVIRNFAVFAEQQSGAKVTRIRIRQHVPVPREYLEVEPDIDPDAPEFFRNTYEAIVVDGNVLPVVDRREAAGGASETPPSSDSATPASPSPTTDSQGSADAQGGNS